MKPYATKFYKSQAWKDCREAYAKSQGYLCETCRLRGIYRPGVIVHHVEELTPLNIHRPEVSLNFENLRLLCRECHAEAHKKHNEGKRYIFGENGEVIVTE